MIEIFVVGVVLAWLGFGIYITGISRSRGWWADIMFVFEWPWIFYCDIRAEMKKRKP